MGRANSAAGNEVDMCTQLFQWYLTLCDPVDCILTGSSVHGILQARILEWVAMPSSGDFPNQGIDPNSCTTSRFFTYVAQLVKNPPAMWETWVRKIPWRRERLPTPYSGLENSMDRILHGVAKSWRRLSEFHFSCWKGVHEEGTQNYNRGPSRCGTSKDKACLVTFQGLRYFDFWLKPLPKKAQFSSPLISTVKLGFTRKPLWLVMHLCHLAPWTRLKCF